MEKFSRISGRTNWQDFGKSWRRCEFDTDHAATAATAAGVAAHQAAHDGHLRAHAQPAGRVETAYGLREREMPEPLGMLEQGHGDVHDWRRPLHAGVRV